MKITGVLVTRGNVDVDAVLASWPADWQRVIWNNSVDENLGVYGRYAALDFAVHDVVFCQDDDCLLAPETFAALEAAYEPGRLVANMPAQYAKRYPDSALVGFTHYLPFEDKSFGALFDRRLPDQAFARYRTAYPGDDLERPDVIFSALTPRTIIAAAFEHLPWATNGDRAFRQDGHTDARQAVLGRCRGIREEDDDRR